MPKLIVILFHSPSEDAENSGALSLERKQQDPEERSKPTTNINRIDDQDAEAQNVAVEERVASPRGDGTTPRNAENSKGSSSRSSRE